jgi:hypothetical protein
MRVSFFFRRDVPCEVNTKKTITAKFMNRINVQGNKFSLNSNFFVFISDLNRFRLRNNLTLVFGLHSRKHK